MASLEIVSNTPPSPLQLLKQVRDIMRRPEDAQSRLNKLVSAIAKGLNSDVCSIYFAREGKWLELFATQGLNQTAVHQTNLRYDEGLVGEIATTSMTLNLAEAQNHPKFIYRKETGEEAFHAFVGVPILYHHRVIGVLVVQSADSRIYSDDEVEILQTVAMVLAELAIGSTMVKLNELTGRDEQHRASHYFSGNKISPGLAKATAILHRPQLQINQLVSDNPSYEEKRLENALTELQQSIDEIVRTAGLQKDEHKLEIIETYRMFTQDRGWLERIIEAIRTGLTAEAAVKKVEEEMHARMMQIESTYIRERMQDLEDLSNRLIYHLAGVSPTAAKTELPDAFVLVAKSIGPAELLEYAGKSIKGIIVEEGSAGSHVAIIARMMDIPMVGSIPGATTHCMVGDPVIVDGDNAEVYLRPPADVDEAIDEHLANRTEKTKAYEAQQDLLPVTQDGVSVAISANIGLYLDAAALSRPDIHGVGLYRTELPYMASNDIPDVDEQKKIYSEVFRFASGKPVIFRSFDIGGDKNVPYLDAGLEENPAMGWRATRVGLDRPVILRRQFRALIRAAGGHELYIMFPFVADVEEFDETKAIFDREMERAKVEGQRQPSAVHIGCMIEIPSILFQLPALFKRVEFVSIGSNDLLQFLYACDRGSERLSGRYDPLSTTFMQVVRDIVKQADAANVSVGFCGAMASKPLEAMALIGCGIRHLSIPLSAVGPVKDMIRSMDAEALAKEMKRAQRRSGESLRSALERFAQTHEIPL